MAEIKLNRVDLKAAAMSVSAFIKASGPGLANLKPNSLEWKVFAANTDIRAKLELADKLYDLDPSRADVGVELDRNQTKVLIATLVHTATIQNKTLEAYESRAENHPCFSNMEGRRKQDYMSNLMARANEVIDVLDKLRATL